MKLNSQRVLSIDWDYVTGDCSVEDEYGSHPHCGFCTYSSTRRRGSKYYLDNMWSDKKEQLLDLGLYQDTPVFVAECHADIMNIMEYFDTSPEVFDYDAHFDYYDTRDNLHCGNWVYHFEKHGGKVHRRPREIGKVGAIFICRSSPWTPRCMDREFCKLIKEIAYRTKVEPTFIGHRKTSMRRLYKKLADWNPVFFKIDKES